MSFYMDSMDSPVRLALQRLLVHAVLRTTFYVHWKMLIPTIGVVCSEY